MQAQVEPQFLFDSLVDIEALYARVPLGMRLGLEAMRAACKQFGHPEAAFPSVHVAGTKSKRAGGARVANDSTSIVALVTCT